MCGFSLLVAAIAAIDDNDIVVVAVVVDRLAVDFDGLQILSFFPLFLHLHIHLHLFLLRSALALLVVDYSDASALVRN